jgi:steroid delta-isomerase-like uncharacterized protein
MADLEAARAYLQGWIDRDMAAIHASLTEDGTYEDPSTGGPIAGDALRSYVTGLWAAFPDLSFEIESLASTGPDTAAAQWVMTGTNTGSMRGLPPTGRAVRLRGADFFALAEGRVRTVTGYFDTAGVPRQLGLDVIVQPSAIGPFRFGISTLVQTGRTEEPGAFGITYLDARGPDEVLKVREGARASMIDMLKMDGFIAATTATIGTRMVTISAWDSPEDARRVMREGAHADVMRGMSDGTLARGGHTGVWTKHHINPPMIRCESCGQMTRGSTQGQICRCGAPLPDPLPYW